MDIEKLDFDKNKYLLVGYFIRKIREDGIYPEITDVYHFVQRSVWHDDWRRRVIEDQGRKCMVCGKDNLANDDLFISFKGGIKQTLKYRNIRTIEQAINTKYLWDTARGEVRCKEHWSRKSKVKQEYKPSEKDAQYIRDYLKIDGIELLATHMQVDLEDMQKYCRDMGLIK